MWAEVNNNNNTNDKYFTKLSLCGHLTTLQTFTHPCFLCPVAALFRAAELLHTFQFLELIWVRQDSITCHNQLPCGPPEHFTVHVFPRPPAKLRARLKQDLVQITATNKSYFFSLFPTSYGAFYCLVISGILVFLAPECSFHEKQVGAANASVKCLQRHGCSSVQVKTDTVFLTFDSNSI